VIAVPSDFERVAILGTGLIGGSFALALRERAPGAHIVGWDRPEVLAAARGRRTIDEGTTDLPTALRGADLVYLALPIGTTLDALPEVARHANAGALVTDSCSTKAVICHTAQGCFAGPARFLGGHPMAGREAGGIENAAAGIFHGAKYALISEERDPDERVGRFAGLVRAMGAVPLWLDAETHDWAAALVSHLPQLLSVALGSVLRSQQEAESGLPLALAGPGLRDALRLAGSPYDIWRDVCITNRDNLRRALDRIAQALDHLRNHLASHELQEEFAAANEVYKILREMK
jgi:prephenate dehydrogenase